MTSAKRHETTSSGSFRGRKETFISLEEGGVEECPFDRLEREYTLAQKHIQVLEEKVKEAAQTSNSSKALLKPRDVALSELKHLQGMEVIVMFSVDLPLALYLQTTPNKK